MARGDDVYQKPTTYFMPSKNKKRKRERAHMMALTIRVLFPNNFIGQLNNGRGGGSSLQQVYPLVAQKKSFLHSHILKGTYGSKH